jgi:hypothetical protein
LGSRQSQVIGLPGVLTDRRKAIIVQYEDVHNIIYSFKIRYDIRNQREIRVKKYFLRPPGNPVTKTC